jgi:type II secretory pathway component PulF
MAGASLELIRVGEASGKLEEACSRVHTVEAERFAWRLEWTARGLNGLIYALAMLAAALAILSAYGGYYGQIEQISREIDAG